MEFGEPGARLSSKGRRRTKIRGGHSSSVAPANHGGGCATLFLTISCQKGGADGAFATIFEAGTGRKKAREGNQCSGCEAPCGRRREIAADRCARRQRVVQRPST